MVIQFWILDLQFWIGFQSKIRLGKFAQRGEPPHATFRKI
ncbi:hypothetical protein FDUTEX481_02995 [Tolypothrix sp. PCC 7601]|nr:hypothetical protein FDUTEX481_02995 [Tolypothrix sp. PCC 7601]